MTEHDNYNDLDGGGKGIAARVPLVTASSLQNSSSNLL